VEERGRAGERVEDVLDAWPYRGIEDLEWPAPMGHEYAGIVQEVGSEVGTVKPSQFVVGSFWASDNTCEICRTGYQSACVNRVPMAPWAPKLSCCASRSPTAPSSPPPASQPTI
jgi:hypothetical protein